MSPAHGGEDQRAHSLSRATDIRRDEMLDAMELSKVHMELVAPEKSALNMMNVVSTVFLLWAAAVAIGAVVLGSSPSLWSYDVLRWTRNVYVAITALLMVIYAPTAATYASKNQSATKGHLWAVAAPGVSACALGVLAIVSVAVGSMALEDLGENFFNDDDRWNGEKLRFNSVVVLVVVLVVLQAALSLLLSPAAWAAHRNYAVRGDSGRKLYEYCDSAYSLGSQKTARVYSNIVTSGSPYAGRVWAERTV